MAKHANRTILVTGATGHQGGAVLKHLRDKGFPVRAVTRDPDQPEARRLVGRGTEVVRGDLMDQASLTRAMDGIYGVYSVQPSHGQGDEVQMGINVADAAKRSRVSQLVYSSVGSADQKTGIPHFETKNRIEEHLRGTGLHYTILRPAFFMENWLGMREAIEGGTLAQPLKPETRLQMIAVDDIGALAAHAFEKPGAYQGRTVELAGDELSMTELAQAFSRITGKEVRYQEVPWEEFEKRAGAEVTSMYRWFQDVGYHVDIGALRNELPTLTGFERWLHSRWTKTMTA